MRAEAERRWAVGLMDALDKQRQRILVSFLDEFQSDMTFGAPTQPLDATLEQEAQPIVSGEYAQIITTEEVQLRQLMERRAEKLIGRRTTMNTCMRVLATLSFVLLSGHAAANATLKNVVPTFHHPGNGALSAGLLVEASTSLPVLIIAGGFTITCTTSTLPLTAERRATFTGFFGHQQIVAGPGGDSQHVSDTGMVEHARREPAHSA